MSSLINLQMMSALDLVYSIGGRPTLLSVPPSLKYVVRSIASVRLSASNTERNNSLHKLLIGDKRVVNKNMRSYKLLYVYQNARALDKAKAYIGCDYASPYLSYIQATLVFVDDDRQILILWALMFKTGFVSLDKVSYSLMMERRKS